MVKEDRKEEAMSAARFKQVADASRIEKAVAALNAKGFAAQSVPNAAAAKEAVLKLIPAGSEVFTFTSATLDATGITEALNAAPYVSLRDKMYALDRNTQSAQMRAIGSAPAFAAGSVHAVTEDGKLVIAKVNIDENDAAATDHGVRAIPTMLLFKGGKVVETLVGMMPKAGLKAKLTPHLG